MRCGVYVRVSTDDQRDNGYSIDSQLRMIKEYCEKNDYDIVDIYNDAGHSGKDLMRPEMQRLLKDIKSKKIDKLVAIKVDRLTRNNYDGFWLLNYCEEHDVKIELILEPYDVSTANGEMIFGMNLVFGQRERKEIGARTKRAMEEMALEKIHPSKAPYGYIRNKDTGHLEVEPIEAQVVKEIFELCKKGQLTRNIATIMKDNNAYLKRGKWASDRVYKILTNSIYIGVFEYGKYKRKPQDVLRVENYCESIIDINTWNTTRANLEKNKHPNYGEHIHLFAGLVKCPICNEILAASESFKTYKGNTKVYYHLRCKNTSCKGYGYHYNSDKIEDKLKRILNELTRFMYDNSNDVIKKEIDKLTKKKTTLDPDNDFKEYTVELLKKLDYEEDNGDFIFKNNLSFTYLFDSLNRKAQKELINRLISSIEITRDNKFNIEIKSIKFTEEFISKSTQDYIDYLNELLADNNIGITYKEQINKEKLLELENDYTIMSLVKMENNQYTEEELNNYFDLMKEHFYVDGIINCPYIEGNNIVDTLILIPKTELINV